MSDELQIVEPILPDRRPSPEVLAKIYETFLHSDLDITDLAIEYGISRLMLAKVAREGKWLDRKHELEVDLFRSADDKYRRFLIEHRMPVLIRHLRVAGNLEEAVEQTLTKMLAGDLAIKPSELKQLADALSSASTVSGRAAGISETPFSDAAMLTHHAQTAKTPLVVINAGPQVPVQQEMKNVTPQPPTIDVVETEQT